MARSANRTILVNNIGITISSVNEQDYISLTDMVSGFDGGSSLIEAWLRNKDTIEFLGVWERINNDNFNSPEFEGIKNQAGANRFSLSAKKWIDATNAIGLIAKAGRYGGTYAHKDIAFEFGSWLSPEFKLYLIKEFQRLKEQEASQSSIEWQIKRELAKVNYRLQTDAVQAHLLENKPKSQHGFVYASEADLINMVVFGKSNQDWKRQNQGIKGNQRDHGSALDNAIIANLEFQNSLMIEQGASQSERVTVLKKLERTLRSSMGNSPAMQRLEQQSNSPLLGNEDDK
ncbi:KilA-N domain-containing protein [Providencia rettgeri]|uniref:KilA-N domain-containing protein n=1 Tax=Providencia TaxID=586 RepID=UPI00234B460E|nr:MULTISPECIES: KilA-N domain-containing protein [Providencia]